MQDCIRMQWVVDMDEIEWLCSELRPMPLLANGEIEETQGSGWVKKRSDKERSDRDADSTVKPNARVKSLNRWNSKRHGIGAHILSSLISSLCFNTIALFLQACASRYTKSSSRCTHLSHLHPLSQRLLFSWVWCKQSCLTTQFCQTELKISICCKENSRGQTMHCTWNSSCLVMFRDGKGRAAEDSERWKKGVMWLKSRREAY